MSTVLRTLPFWALPAPPTKSSKPLCISVRQRSSEASCFRSLRLSVSKPLRFVNFVSFASEGETETQVEVQEPEIVEATYGATSAEDVESEDEVKIPEGVPQSAILASLQYYKEALANSDVKKIIEIKDFLKSIEDESLDLEWKVANLSEELSTERERVFRISADFENFRKRTDRERLSVVTNAQGELVESLLPVLDNFERAKSQIKVGTEEEEKINNSYQSIYKQFVEILDSLGVATVEPKGNQFDPLVNFRVGSKLSRVLDELNRVVNQLHEAIMREESTEFEEGIVLEEYRKGFKLSDRLLRPSMVKVSAGPGPAKAEQVDETEEAPASTEETDSDSVVSEEDSTEAEST